MLEERQLLLVCFHQVKSRGGRDDRHRNRRQSATRTEVENFAGRLQQVRSSERLVDVIVEVRASLRPDQIDLLVPAQEELLIQIQTRIALHSFCVAGASGGSRSPPASSRECGSKRMKRDPRLDLYK